MLRRLLFKIIRFGRLTIRCRGRTFGIFGEDHSGEAPLDVVIHLERKSALWKLALNPNYQLGELYMLGVLQIEHGSLAEFLELCGRNQERFERSQRNKLWRRVLTPLARLFRSDNTRIRSRSNVAHHYDLSNALYRLFLDDDLQYSCAYFAQPGQSLEEAQRAKKIISLRSCCSEKTSASWILGAVGAALRSSKLDKAQVMSPVSLFHLSSWLSLGNERWRVITPIASNSICLIIGMLKVNLIGSFRSACSNMLARASMRHSLKQSPVYCPTTG